MAGMSANPEFVAEIIDSSAKALAEWAVSLQEERSPDLRRMFGAESLIDFRADTQVRVAHLANAVAFDEPDVLASHVAWARSCFASRDVPVEILEQNLACLAEVLDDRLPGSAKPLVERQLDAATRTLREPQATPPSLIEGDGDLMPLARRYLLAILEGERGQAREMLDAAMADGVAVPDLVEHVVRRAQAEIGRMWELGEITVADEHLASASAEWIVSHLMLKAPRAKDRNRVLVASSVGGDTHSFGVRLVADSFEVDGWRTYFLGASTPLVDLVGAVVQRRADLLAISANLGCHLREMKRVIDAVRSQPEASGVVVMVGGKPLSTIDGLWRKLGADGCAPSAGEAVREGNRLVEKRAAG